MKQTILLILLAGLAIGTIPAWPYNRHWSFAPSGALVAILGGVVALVALGWV